MIFKDRLNVEVQKGKRVISVRDGIQTYYGAEIGKEPFNKVFRIYRSPETIKAIVDKMLGLPVTDDHVELSDIPEDKIIGEVKSAEVVELNKPNVKATLAIRNEIEFRDNVLEFGKSQLSLGYFAELIEGDGKDYDFEQIDIIPHHLAIVERGRCGDSCKFTDKGSEVAEEQNTQQTQKQKQEQRQSINLQQIAEVVRDLPEAIKLMDVEEFKKLIPLLQEAINKAREKTPQMQAIKTEEEGVDKTPTTDAQIDFKDTQEFKKLIPLLQEAINKAREKTPQMQAIKTEEEGVDKTPTTDAQIDFKDTQEFKDAVKQYGNERAEVILKAKQFLGDSYEFADKDTLAIMQEVLKKETGQEFSDAEAPVAFKLLKKFKDYSNFADTHTSVWDKLKDKEL